MSIERAGAEENKRPHICILVYDEIDVFEYGLALEVFGSARAHINNWYTCESVAIEQGAICGLGGVRVDAPYDLSILQAADMIIIPGWRGVDDPISEDLRTALVRANRVGVRLVSMGLGACVLAQCGLLGGRQATTHWGYSEQFKARYPDIRMTPDVQYVDTGDILTSAGHAGSFDLYVHIVRKDFGVQIAKRLARQLALPVRHEGGGFEYSAQSMPASSSGNIGALLDQVREKLDHDWSVESLAALAKTSTRTLQRRFKNVTGYSPHVWLTKERVELAKDLLETTHLNIHQIAAITGLKTPETFRHHFKINTGISPSQFRSNFNTLGRHEA